MGIPLFGQEHVDRYRETDGEKGHDWQGTSVLLLTTTGRKSGAKRTTPLIYQRHGDDYLVVASNGGGIAECHFDGWNHTASLALTGAQEFANRNTDIANVLAAATMVMPAIELGNHDDVQRLNFADASQWKDYGYGDGSDGGPNGIADTQASGYPAALNHPGLPGGSLAQPTIDTNAFNADIMEACPRGTDVTMITIWDAILSKGVSLVGCSWSNASPPGINSTGDLDNRTATARLYDP